MAARWPRPQYGAMPARRAGSQAQRGLAARRIPVPAVQLYVNRVTVPLTGGQGEAIVSSGGTANVSVAPAGLGVIWYPVQATISTTSGILDSSTFNLYLGPAGVPITLVGFLFPGGFGTIALAIPSMTPGQALIAQWTGGHAGDLASINVIGTMSALTP
jgi:hypothetical protein